MHHRAVVTAVVAVFGAKADIGITPTPHRTAR